MIFKDEELRKAISNCMKNADNLLHEAKILYSANRYPRAFFLCIKAMGEIGKMSLLAAHLGGKLNSFIWKPKYLPKELFLQFGNEFGEDQPPTEDRNDTKQESHDEKKSQ